MPVSAGAWPLSFAPVLLLATFAACEPCAGVSSCGGAEIRYRGQLVAAHSGQPLAEARVQFVPAERGSGALATRTDSLGYFRLEGEAGAPGQLRGQLDVIFDDGTVVDTLANVTISTSLSSGDSRYLGSWRVAWPHFESYGQLLRRATGKPLSGVQVEFRRTGGVHARPDTFVVTSDAFGNFPLRPRPLVAQGEMVGDLIIRPGAPLSADTVRGVRIRSYTEADPGPFVGRWSVGPVLPYVGRALWPDGSPAAGVAVEFRRTGGIELEQAQYVTTTNGDGAFSLGPVPLAPGVVSFTLTFAPPAPRPAVTYAYSLRTVEKDGPIILIESWVLPR